VKKILFLLLVFLNGCASALNAPGFYAAGWDNTIKSKEILNEKKCEWRCYDENTLSGLEKRLDRLFGQ